MKKFEELFEGWKEWYEKNCGDDSDIVYIRCKDAVKEMGKNTGCSSHILNCARGKYEKMYGYKWKIVGKKNKQK